MAHLRDGPCVPAPAEPRNEVVESQPETTKTIEQSSLIALIEDAHLEDLSEHKLATEGNEHHLQGNGDECTSPEKGKGKAGDDQDEDQNDDKTEGAELDLSKRHKRGTDRSTAYAYLGQISPEDIAELIALNQCEERYLAEQARIAASKSSPYSSSSCYKPRPLPPLPKKMPGPNVPKPGPAKLTKNADLAEWLEEAKQCHYLPENVMKQLCEVVKEQLMEGASSY